MVQTWSVFELLRVVTTKQNERPVNLTRREWMIELWRTGILFTSGPTSGLNGSAVILVLERRIEGSSQIYAC